MPTGTVIQNRKGNKPPKQVITITKKIANRHPHPEGLSFIHTFHNSHNGNNNVKFTLHVKLTLHM